MGDLAAELEFAVEIEFVDVEDLLAEVVVLRIVHYAFKSEVVFVVAYAETEECFVIYKGKIYKGKIPLFRTSRMVGFLSLKFIIWKEPSEVSPTISKPKRSTSN